MNSAATLSFPAEWESDGAVMLAWPHEATDWQPMLQRVWKCYADIVAAITPHQPVVIVAPDTAQAREMLKECAHPNRIFYINIPTNDTWTRDYGPLTVIDADGRHSLLDFCFNGWGMKFAADMDNLVSSRMKEKGFLTAPLRNCRDFILEGGGIESDGRGTIMTTAHCQMSPNRNATLSADEIKQRLKTYFGASNLLWIEHGYLAGDDTDSHVDTLARFAPNDTILYVGCQNQADEHFAELQAMAADIAAFRTLEGQPYNLMELPMPDAIYDAEGQRLPATYANFLALPEVMIVPSYGQERNDRLAAQIIEVAFERKTVSVDCRALIEQHGSLHCATMQLPKQVIAI